MDDKSVELVQDEHVPLVTGRNYIQTPDNFWSIIARVRSKFMAYGCNVRAKMSARASGWRALCEWPTHEETCRGYIPPKRPTETQATCSYKYSVLASSIIISTQTPSFSQSWHKTQRQMEAILNYPLTMSMKELVTSSQFVCQWQNCKTKLPHIAIAEVASANHWHLSSIFLQIDWVMLLCTWGRY